LLFLVNILLLSSFHNMIVQPTVFVLGAGASEPYGFPLGSNLAAQICAIMPSTVRNQPPTNEHFRLLQKWLKEGGHEVDVPAASELSRRFLESGCLTLDEFLEPAGNHGFLPLIKAAIAYHLILHEQDSHLVTVSPKTDWVAYLFREMRTSDPAEFEKNTVRFITFNCDRSLERKLFLMLRSSYGISDAEASQIAAKVPIAHVHGSLGGASWFPNSDHGARDYANDVDRNTYGHLVDEIRIIHEEVRDSNVLTTIHEWLRQAHTICFLGFGFHPTNTGRLNLMHPYTAAIFGTALGLSRPEIMRAQRRFMSGVTLFADLDCYRLIREIGGVLQTDGG